MRFEVESVVGVCVHFGVVDPVGVPFSMAEHESGHPAGSALNLVVLRLNLKGWERVGKGGKGWERVGKGGKGWEGSYFLKESHQLDDSVPCHSNSFQPRISKYKESTRE